MEKLREERWVTLSETQAKDASLLLRRASVLLRRSIEVFAPCPELEALHRPTAYALIELAKLLEEELRP